MEDYGEGCWGESGRKESPEPSFDFDFQPSALEQVRNWIRKQGFVACDLSAEFVGRFLDASNQDVLKAREKIRKYFVLRQEPGPIFRDTDLSSPTNRKLLGALYAVPLRNLFKDGEVILLTGSLRPTVKYSLLAHFKLFALTIDYLLWDKMNKFTDLKILMDGSNFACPALLENPFRNFAPFVNDFQGSTPFAVQGFYLFHPPEHVKKIAHLNDGIWLHILESKEEVSSRFPSAILPFEFGGSLGRLDELLDTWNRQVKQRSKFFCQLEKRMINDHRRRLCREKEVKAGKNWAWKMKLVADETEFKKRYYEKMSCYTPIVHPAFGRRRRANMPKETKVEDPLRKIRELAAEDEPEKIPTKIPEKVEYPRPGTVEIIFCNMTELYGEDVGEALATDRSTERIGETTDRTFTEWEGEVEPEGRPKDTTADEDSEPEIDLGEELKQFKYWLEREPYLPHDVDEEILITFLWDSESVEEAEAKFMNYYYARQSVKKVFADRHPCSPNNLLKYDAVCVVPLTGREVKKWIIFAAWLAHDDPEKFCPYQQAKLIFTELDILMQENQIRGKTISIILDMKNYTPEHTEKITKYASKKICYLFTDCFPAKFNGFYLVNTPDHVADYTNLFGPFDFHIVEYLDDLPGFLPKQFLTSDLAGEPDAPARDELFDPFFKRMRRCGNWLAYEEFQRSKETMLRMTTTREEWMFKD